MQNYLDLTGRTALVTGASSGSGAATAKVFADLGARLATTYHNNQKGAEQVAREISNTGGKVITIKADVRRTPDIHAMVKRTTDELGPIDILVNNAGSLVK